MKGAARALLTAALRTYPRDFREAYREQIFSDAAEFGPGAELHIAWDAFVAGMAMRFDGVARDLQYALRTLRRSPLFTAVVTATLAIAIAANTIVFSLLNAVLLAPLPYAHPESLALGWGLPSRSLAAAGMSPVPLAAVHALRNDRLFNAAAGYLPAKSSILTPAGSAEVPSLKVTANYFSVLGVEPKAGRFFSARDSGRQAEAVISDRLWRERFDGSPSVVGSFIRVDGKPLRVIGVAQRGLLDPIPGDLQADDLWTLLSNAGGNTVTFKTSSEGSGGPPVPPAEEQPVMAFPLLRLAPGISAAAASAELERVTNNVDGKTGGLSTGNRVERVRTAIFGSWRLLLWIVYGAVVGVLLIACANVANLLLARSSARGEEFAIRTALGAAPRRVAQQLLTETFVLALFGAGAGVAAAYVLLPWTRSLLPATIPRLRDASVSAPVLGYTALLVLAVTVLAGSVPALARRRRAAGRTALASGAAIRAVLAAVQIAIAFTLTVGAGLLLQSFERLTSTNIGFDPHHLYAAPFLLTGNAQAMLPPAQTRDRLRAVPGVTGAAIATMVPFSNALVMVGHVNLHGRTSDAAPSPMHDAHSADGNWVSPNFFRLIGTRTIAGRIFSASSPATDVVVNEAFVRRFLRGARPLGVHFEWLGDPATIVGVVGDTKNSLTAPGFPTVYRRQADGPASLPFYQIVLRTNRHDPQLASDIRRALGPRAATMDRVVSIASAVDEDSVGVRTSLTLLGTLAAAALVLALAGIYAIVAYATRRRYHEFGIRFALGATPARVVGNVITAAALQSLIGVAAGIVLAGYATRFLADRLYQTSPLNPASYVGAALLLIACAGIAALVPAWRAARLDPAATLRYE